MIFYITGESYAGHYVPTLAERVLDNQSVNKINMKGLFIGNPAIDDDWYYSDNDYPFISFMYQHGLIPQTAFTQANDKCGWSDYLTNCASNYTNPSADCIAASTTALSYIPNVMDPYDVYAPTCHESSDGDDFVSMYTPFLHNMRRKHNLATTYDPCISRQTPIYMNNPAVQKAIHADSHPCVWPGPGIQYGDETANMILLFQKFFELAPDWKILIFSGDVDSAVPFTGTLRWIECLGRPVVQDWRNWWLDGDAAGIQKDFDRISYVTIKGCGHTVPTYCPEAGYQFYANWFQSLGY